MYSGCWLCRRQRLGFNLCKLFCGRFPFMHCAKLIKPYCLNYVDSNTLPNLGQLWEKSPENHNFGLRKTFGHSPMYTVHTYNVHCTVGTSVTSSYDNNQRTSVCSTKSQHLRLKRNLSSECSAGKTRANCSRKVREIESGSWERWLGWQGWQIIICKRPVPPDDHLQEPRSSG